MLSRSYGREEEFLHVASKDTVEQTSEFPTLAPTSGDNLKVGPKALVLAPSGAPICCLLVRTNLLANMPGPTMEITDAGFRHIVAFRTLNIQHIIDLSPSTVSFTKEVRYCVLAVVIGFTTTSIVKSVLNYRRRRD